MQYVIRTESGHKWLIEDATDEADALSQYYDGDADQHTSVAVCTDASTAEYLREQGQAS